MRRRWPGASWILLPRISKPPASASSGSGAARNGKSTLAAGLASELGAVLFRSDEVRKELAGLPAGAHGPGAVRERHLRAEATAETYDELLNRAAVPLGMGETVILDASWASAAWRERSCALAARTMSDMVELRCEAPVEVAAARLRRRAGAGVDPSDATSEIAESMVASTAPWPQAMTVDTTQDPSQVLDRTLSRLQPWPRCR